MAGNRRNQSLALSLAAIALGMGMLAYASVPLYRVFCRATGFGGTAVPALMTTEKALARKMTVRFDANVNPALPWEFRPEKREVTVKIGEQGHIDYIARNLSRTPTRGTATFNITPVKAGQYFSKIQCFCFTEQALAPGESKHLPVTFFINPDIAKDKDAYDVDTITLSYTFFPVQPTPATP